MKLSFAVAFLFWSCLSLCSQNLSEPIKENFEWNKESEEKSISFHVNEGTKFLSIQFEGAITNGKLFVKVYNPDSIKTGELILKSGSYKKNKKKVNGTFTNSSSNKKKVHTKSSSIAHSKSVSHASSSGITNNESKGIMNETYTNPEVGTWKFVIFVKDATGKLSAHIKQQ